MKRRLSADKDTKPFVLEVLVEGEGCIHAPGSHDQEAHLVHEAHLAPPLCSQAPDCLFVSSSLDPFQLERSRVLENAHGDLEPKPLLEEGSAFNKHIVVREEGFASSKSRRQPPLRFLVIRIALSVQA